MVAQAIMKFRIGSSLMIADRDRGGAMAFPHRVGLDPKRAGLVGGGLVFAIASLFSWSLPILTSALPPGCVALPHAVADLDGPPRDRPTPCVEIRAKVESARCLRAWSDAENAFDQRFDDSAQGRGPTARLRPRRRRAGRGSDRLWPLSGVARSRAARAGMGYLRRHAEAKSTPGTSSKGSGRWSSSG